MVDSHVTLYVYLFVLIVLFQLFICYLNVFQGYVDKYVKA